MRLGRQDLNVFFFTFRSCRQLEGRQPPRPIKRAIGTHFWKFPYSAYIFEILLFFKYKNEKSPRIAPCISAALAPAATTPHANGARAAAGPQDVVFIGGSTFVVAEVAELYTQGRG